MGEWAFRDSGVEECSQGPTLNESSIVLASEKQLKATAFLVIVFVSEEYRAAMAKVYAKRALTQLS